MQSERSSQERWGLREYNRQSLGRLGRSDRIVEQAVWWMGIQELTGLKPCMQPNAAFDSDEAFQWYGIGEQKRRETINLFRSQDMFLCRQHALLKQRET